MSERDDNPQPISEAVHVNVYRDATGRMQYEVQMEEWVALFRAADVARMLRGAANAVRIAADEFDGMKTADTQAPGPRLVYDAGDQPAEGNDDDDAA